MPPKQKTPVPATLTRSAELTNAIQKALTGSFKSVKKANTPFEVVDERGVASIPAAVYEERNEEVIKAVWRKMKPVVKLWAEEWSVAEKERKARVKARREKGKGKGRGKEKVEEVEKTEKVQDGEVTPAELMRRVTEAMRERRRAQLEALPCFCVIDCAGQTAEMGLPVQEELIRVFMDRFWS